MGRSWVGLGPCKERRMMELILGQQETVQHIAAPHRTCEANTFRDEDVLLCPRLVAWVVPYLPPGSQGPWRRDWDGVRGGSPVAGRVRVRVNSNFFTLTDLTCWADGI